MVWQRYTNAGPGVGYCSRRSECGGFQISMEFPSFEFALFSELSTKLETNYAIGTLGRPTDTRDFLVPGRQEPMTA